MFTEDKVKPHYAEDGIDVVKCDVDKCMYRDSSGRCLFETCVAKNYPYCVSYHKTFTHKCKLCNKDYTIENTDVTPPINNILEYMFCPNCISRMSKIIGDTNIVEE